MAGNTFGDDTTPVIAYAGVASYLNIGDKDIVTNNNNVFVVNDPAVLARKDRSSDSEPRSDSTIGAPVGPYKVCISKYEASATDKCGAARTFKPGKYFSWLYFYFFLETDDSFFTFLFIKQVNINLVSLDILWQQLILVTMTILVFVCR